MKERNLKTQDQCALQLQHKKQINKERNYLAIFIKKEYDTKFLNKTRHLAKLKITKISLFHKNMQFPAEITILPCLQDHPRLNT